MVGNDAVGVDDDEGAVDDDAADDDEAFVDDGKAPTGVFLMPITRPLG